VLLSTKTVAQANINFGQVPTNTLCRESLMRIAAKQHELRLDANSPISQLATKLKRFLFRLIKNRK
jgi:diketogulonate reductase-like aldo/keto reductase